MPEMRLAKCRQAYEEKLGGVVVVCACGRVEDAIYTSSETIDGQYWCRACWALRQRLMDEDGYGAFV